MASAGTYHFDVPDRAAAERLAEALSAFGFPQTGAWPLSPRAFGSNDGMTWEVGVVDEGPYPHDLAGYRQEAAVKRQAHTIARAHGGFMTLEVSHGAGPHVPSLQRANPPILLLRPGSRPPVPLIRVLPPPPPGALSLTPDSPVRTLIRPDDLGLDAVPWPELTAACIPAADIPAEITRLVQRPGNWDNNLDGLVFSYLVHQGSCYSATGPALVILARLATAGAVTAAKRRDIYLALLYAATRYDDDLIADAYRAAAYGRAPEPGPWTREVKEAVGGVTPGLLARWPSEPSACQLALAALAAAFPGHGQAVTPQIAALADEYTGTQVGAYARLAYHLVSGETARTLAAIAEIAAWNDEIDPEIADDESIQPESRALILLDEAVLSAATRLARS